jgi:hypothetical protein
MKPQPVDCNKLKYIGIWIKPQPVDYNELRTIGVRMDVIKRVDL